MKMMKLTRTILPLFFTMAACAARATILLDDPTNYPYVNGSIEGQGQWYAYSPASPKQNAFVTNNVLYLVTSSTNDAVATPTNGWVNPNPITYASFMINVSQLPASPNGGYFCQLQNNNDTNDVCHVFIDTLGTTVPGTYRLGIGNFVSSFTALTPPVNYSQDLAPGIWYKVVIAYGNINAPVNYQGGTLWIDPSEADYISFVDADNFEDQPGFGYIYGVDTSTVTNQEDINITQIGFSPFATAGISNVVASTAFDDVNATNLPVFGIQPQSGTNYSGNPTSLYAVASAVDGTYQWYSTTFGKLSDGAAYTGTTSNTLTVTSLSASDSYYCVATDAYGNDVTTTDAVETVILTPTAPFFPTNVAVTNIANLFTVSGFTNTALGTGPLYYQWYFAPTNAPNTFSPLSGQNGPGLTLNLVDSTYQGNYYVIVSNTVSGGSLAVGPTNTLVEIAPLIATMLQLHNLEISVTNQLIANPFGTITISSNNVTVSGYVSQFAGYGSSYSEFFMQDAAGLGVEVFLGGHGNTNTPPIGTYLTIQAPLEIFEGTLELAPTSLAAFTTNAPPAGELIAPRLENANFGIMNTNTFGTNDLLYGSSLVTFTNVYIYGTKTGGAFGTGGTHSGAGGLFQTNTFTQLYFTIGGPYQAGVNTNTMEIFQPGSNFGTRPSPFALTPIPTFCYQLTGIYEDFGGTAEVAPSRLADYVTNPPPAFTASLAVSNRVPSVAWTPQVGSTYSVYSSTTLQGPWTQAAYGLAYYPTNGSFTDATKARVKLYDITTP